MEYVVDTFTTVACGQGTQVLAAGQEHSLNDIPGPVKWLDTVPIFVTLVLITVIILFDFYYRLIFITI